MLESLQFNLSAEKNIIYQMNITLIEHGLLSSEKFDVSSLHLELNSNAEGEIPKYLGLNYTGYVSYYVGAAWLVENKTALIVYPKFKDIDFVSIFSAAFSEDIKLDYLQNSYSINFSAPPIEDKTLDSILSPLIVAHFICVIKRLLLKGLRKQYIIREENLKNKTKGHVLPFKTFQKNVIRGHAEKTYCRFQEYSCDTPENRLLKKALIAAISIVGNSQGLLIPLRKYLSAFHNVSENATYQPVNSFRKDKLHTDYPEAIRLAKIILRKKDFSISQNGSVKHLVPEFAIDMSRIFEFYTLSWLRKNVNTKVLFQEEAGIMGICDYLIPAEKLIIDAKYKYYYNIPFEKLKKETKALIIADIREVAGYGRSERIRKILNVEADDKEVKCLIIYPIASETKELNDKTDLFKDKIKGVSNFYKLGVPVPLLKH